MYSTQENVPRMYCTPKIHKEETALQPTVDCTGSIGYNTSRALSDILALMLGKAEFHVKNSTDIANFLKDFKVEDNEILVSHDVDSLFTNSPIHDTLEYIRERLEKDTTLKLRTNLAISDIIELLRFICKTTYFMFNGTVMQQKFGMMMGSPVLAIASNFYMEKLERDAFRNCSSRVQAQVVVEI